MATVDCAASQTGMVAQDGIQCQLILTNKRVDAIILVPILAEGKKFRDGYSKKARFSVKMWIVFGIASSYSLDAKTSRGRARHFF